MADARQGIDKFEYVGNSPNRVDARDKVMGRAVYMDDIQLSGLLHGKVLRSKYAHARILRVDVSRALKVAGVKGVVTGAELPFLHGESLMDEPLLARDKVRYTGEGVAAIAAVDEATAEEALGLIEVEYEELPGVFDPVEASKPGAPLIHEQVEEYKRASSTITPVAGTNICNYFELKKGDVEKGFAESDYIFEDTYSTPMQVHATIEPHGAIALVDDETNITIWANNDSPHRARKEIAGAFDVPLTKVRVITPSYVGGNFGGKGGLKAEAVALALAWKIRNRPIKIMYTREEEFSSTIGRHPSIVWMKTGVKKDGTLVARQVKMYLATGAYAEKGPTVTRFGGVSAAGPYRIPNVHIEAYCVYINRQVAGAMRGYGGPQGAWAYESQMDAIAAKLGLDPLELRLKHVYVDGDTHTTGQKIVAEGLRDCLIQVAEGMDWSKPLGKDQGRGIACMERAVKTPFGSAAFVKVNEDGTVDVLSSTTEVGQGSATVISQIVAEELGVPLASVRKAAPDTAFTPYDASTTSSRSTFHMGNAVKMAAADAKKQLLALAAKSLKQDVESLYVREGKVRVRGDPGRAVPIAQVLSDHFGSSGTVLGRGYYIPEVPGGRGAYFTLDMVFWLLGAQGAEVQVDRETGEVKILKLYAAHDAGKVINPDACREQVRGGVALGSGFAQNESLLFKEGLILNPSLLNYKVPSALDVPDIEAMLVECAHPEGPYGAKGIGETTNVPTPPAIANAIYNAVGIRIKDLPITPDKVLEALKAKGEGKSTKHQERAGITESGNKARGPVKVEGLPAENENEAS